MKPVLHTARLTLRPQAESDSLELVAMGMDPQVMRFIADGPMSLQDSEALTLETLEMDGPLGRWMVTDRETGAVLGWAVLTHLDGSDDIEVGYCLKAAVWGKGIAAEAAVRLVRYGFEELGLREIVAVTRAENTASQRVLEKAGLRRRGLRDAFGLRNLHYFVISAPA